MVKDQDTRLCSQKMRLSPPQGERLYRQKCARKEASVDFNEPSSSIICSGRRRTRGCRLTPRVESNLGVVQAPGMTERLPMIASIYVRTCVIAK